MVSNRLSTLHVTDRQTDTHLTASFPGQSCGGGCVTANYGRPM